MDKRYQVTTIDADTDTVSVALVNDREEAIEFLQDQQAGGHSGHLLDLVTGEKEVFARILAGRN